MLNSISCLPEENTSTYDTTTTNWYSDFADEFLSLQKKLELDIKFGSFTKGLGIVDQIDSLLQTNLSAIVDGLKNEFLRDNSVDLTPIFQRLEEGGIQALKSYLLALKKNPEAIAACDNGFNDIQEAVRELMEIAQQEQGFPEIIQFEQGVKKHHKMWRGFEEIALGYKQEAIEDLRECFADEEIFRSNDVKTLFLAKVVERQLQTALLPEFPDADSKDFYALFMAGRYEEVIANRDNEIHASREIEGASLALLGRYTEALEIFEHTYNGESGKALVYLLKGDLELARECAFQKTDDPLAYQILLLIKAN